MSQIKFAALFFLFTNCLDLETAPYDEEFNYEREKVGLKFVDSTYGKALIDTKRFKNEPISRKIKSVGLLMNLKKPALYKKLTFSDPQTGCIIFEEDQYVSGYRKGGINGTVYERLIHRYYFDIFEKSKFQSYSYGFLGKSVGPVIVQKGETQYVYAYPVLSNFTSSNRPNLKSYEEKIEFISRIKADSILQAWKLRK